MGSSKAPEIITNSGTHALTDEPHAAPERKDTGDESIMPTKKSHEWERTTIKQAVTRIKSSHSMRREGTELFFMIQID